MELIKTIIHQVLLFKFDEIPFARLIPKSSVAKLAELFDAGLVNVSDDGAINISGGFFREGNKVLPILRLVIEDRRVLLDLEGSSTEADAVIRYLTSFFVELIDEPISNMFVPIIKSEESEIICKLGFVAERLFPQQLNQFIKGVLSPSLANDYSKVNVIPNHISFFVHFTAPDSKIQEYKIGLSPKEFILGPRPGYAIDDQVYYSRVPLSTNVHLKLIEQFEKVIIEQRSK